ncbi:MAG TPA: ATP-binding protein [Acidobacteriaceae bacterium]|nr:ATP-binding protein [Acidobacteriaceae bacterium]
MATDLAERISDWVIQRALRPFAVAGFFVLVAFLWTLYFQHIIAYPFPFLFLGAVMGSAWFGGIFSGFIAATLSTVLVDYFLVPPLYSLAIKSSSESFLAAFILCAITMILLVSARRRSETAIREARDQLDARVQERTAELRQSNLELEESARRLRMLTDAIPQQMWSADAQGNLNYCNQYLVDSLGAPLAGQFAEAFDAVLHPADEAFFHQALESSLIAEAPFEIEARLRLADGSYRWFLLRAIPQHSVDGRLLRWFGIHVDIEQQHRERQGLIEAHDELSRSSRTLSMGEMAASIAHELNQPLTAVVTHAYACREWLSATPANLEKASATAERIVQESTRAGAVVARVRALFRSNAAIRQPTDINRLVLDFVHLLRDDVARRNMTIRLLLADDLPDAELDAIQIQQVLLNLAGNAMDAMEGGAGPRELTIRTQRQAPGHICVSVEDQGPGLAPETSARLFEPFFTTKRSGMGMGLALCRSIIESHDGRIWAAPSQSGGAAFHFTLPVPA